MLKRTWPLWVVVPSLIVMIVAAGLLHDAKQSSIGQDRQAPRVQIKQQADSSAKGEAQTNQQKDTSADPLTVVKPTPSAQLNEESTSHRSQSAEEPTEFWTIFGRRLKITDTLLAVFTFFLVVIGAWQGRLIINQIRLGRQEFTATNRPKLIVRELHLISGHAVKDMKISFVIVNIGASDARIVESRFAIDRLRPNNPLRREIIDELNEIGEVVIKPGERKPWATKGLERTIAKAQGFEGTLYFHGFITYEDTNGVRRHTASWRQYNAASNRFTIIDDPDYEYAD